MNEKALKQITESVIEPIVRDTNDFSEIIINLEVLGGVLRRAAVVDDLNRNLLDYLQKSIKTIEEITNYLELIEAKQTLSVGKVRNNLDNLLPAIVDMIVKQTIKELENRK